MGQLEIVAAGLLYDKNTHVIFAGSPLPNSETANIPNNNSIYLLYDSNG